jgi:outer membrane protein assembly factor BamB
MWRRTASAGALVAWVAVTAFGSTGQASPSQWPVARWQQALPGWGEPAADASAAYFLTRDHEVVAVDIATGSLKWRTRTGGTGEVPSGTVVRLARAGVIVGDSGIVALDRESGRERFRYTAPDGDDPGVFLGGIRDDLIVAGSPMGRLYALDAATGALHWRREIAGGERRAVFAPAWVGDLVIATFTTFDGALAGGLAAFDRRGNRRWIRHFAAGVGAAGPPAAVGHDAVVARTDGGVEVVEPASGRTIWTLAPEPSTGGAASERDVRALTSLGQRLVVTSFHGPIRAVDAGTRRQQWEYRGGPLDAVALRVRGYGGRIYVPYSDGSLVVLDGATGIERWRIGPEAGSYDWPPAVGSGCVLAGGSHALSAFGCEPHHVPAGRSR